MTNETHPDLDAVLRKHGAPDEYLGYVNWTGLRADLLVLLGGHPVPGDNDAVNIINITVSDADMREMRAPPPNCVVISPDQEPTVFTNCTFHRP